MLRLPLLIFFHENSIIFLFIHLKYMNYFRCKQKFITAKLFTCYKQYLIFQLIRCLLLHKINHIEITVHSLKRAYFPLCTKIKIFSLCFLSIQLTKMLCLTCHDLCFCHCHIDDKCYSQKHLHFIQSTNAVLFKLIITVYTAIDSLHTGSLFI